MKKPVYNQIEMCQNKFMAVNFVHHIYGNIFILDAKNRASCCKSNLKLPYRILAKL